MYIGMMPSCVGTIMVATTSRRKALRPLKRSLAKAKPASVENRMTEAVMTDAASRLLSSASPNGTVSKTRRTLSTRLAPGIIGGGTRPRAELSCDATTTLKYNGNRGKEEHRDQRQVDELARAAAAAAYPCRGDPAPHGPGSGRGRCHEVLLIRRMNR